MGGRTPTSQREHHGRLLPRRPNSPLAVLTGLRLACFPACAPPFPSSTRRPPPTGAPPQRSPAGSRPGSPPDLRVPESTQWPYHRPRLQGHHREGPLGAASPRVGEAGYSLARKPPGNVPGLCGLPGEAERCAGLRGFSSLTSSSSSGPGFALPSLTESPLHARPRAGSGHTAWWAERHALSSRSLLSWGHPRAFRPPAFRAVSLVCLCTFCPLHLC